MADWIDDMLLGRDRNNRPSVILEYLEGSGPTQWSTILQFNYSDAFLLRYRFPEFSQRFDPFGGNVYLVDETFTIGANSLLVDAF